MPPLIAGRYRPIGEIGRGGMGSVLLVEHVHTGDHLALKMLHRSFGDDPMIVERFRREARTAAKIKSDHVVRVTDADISEELGGVPFMVMEVLDGEDVRKRLATRGTLSKEQVVTILWQVGRALDRAHQIGIVHRDIKPENIFLHKREDGTEIVKLLDFGISKMLGDLDASSTQAGMLLGTPYFMAPEQVRNGAITAQTDVWAVGMVAYKLLAGQNYWASASTGELMMLVINQAMDPPSLRSNGKISAAFDAWFFRSCDRDATRRWASAGEQVAALADALGTPLPATISGASAPILPASQSHSGVYTARAAPAVSTPSVSSGPSASTTGASVEHARGFWIAAIAAALAVLVALVVFGAWRIAQLRARENATASAPIAPAATLPTAANANAHANESAAAVAPGVTTSEPSPHSAAIDTQTQPAATTPPMVTATPTATSGHSSHAKKNPHEAASKSDDPWGR